MVPKTIKIILTDKYFGTKTLRPEVIEIYGKKYEYVTAIIVLQISLIIFNNNYIFNIQYTIIK